MQQSRLILVFLGFLSFASCAAMSNPPTHQQLSKLTKEESHEQLVAYVGLEMSHLNLRPLKKNLLLGQKHFQRCFTRQNLVLPYEIIISWSKNRDQIFLSTDRSKVGSKSLVKCMATQFKLWLEGNSIVNGDSGKFLFTGKSDHFPLEESDKLETFEWHITPQSELRVMQ